MNTTGWTLAIVLLFYSVSSIMGLSGLTARLTAFWDSLEKSLEVKDKQ